MRFSERHLRSGGVLSVGDWQVKSYLVTVTRTELEPSIVTAASAFLPKSLPSSAASDATPRVAFSVLHKGVDAVWLNLYSWVYGEILHCRAPTPPSPNRPCSRRWTSR